MATKIVQRKSIGIRIFFCSLRVGEFFTYPHDTERLLIKTNIDSAVVVMGDEEFDGSHRLESVGGEVYCLKVDVSIEWCIAGSI